MALLGRCRDRPTFGVRVCVGCRPAMFLRKIGTKLPYERILGHIMFVEVSCRVVI